MPDQQTKEHELMALAEQLHFTVERHGSRFSFFRDLPDEDEPVRSDRLSLEEAEEFLNRWKLRGLHGG